MKANEAPERLYLSKNIYSTFLYQVPDPDDETAVEYTRTDAFIEKACEKLEKCMYDNLMFQGRLHRKEVIEMFIEDFKKYMEE